MYLERNVTAFHVADVNTRQYLKIYESSISQVLYQSDTQLLNQSNNQCMYSVCHFQLVQYYISQTHSYCRGNQSINTYKTVSVSTLLHQSDTQLLLKQSANQYMEVTVS